MLSVKRKAAAMEQDWAASHAGMLWQQPFYEFGSWTVTFYGISAHFGISIQFGNDVRDEIW